MSVVHLYLFRHGIAQDREDPDCPPEAERALTPRGIRRTRRAARGLRALGLAPEVVLSSSYLRARETAELACRELDVDPASIVLSQALLPEGDPAIFLAELAAQGKSEVLACGHRPNLDLILARAVGVPLGAFTTLEKAGAACIELDDSAGRGSLIWLIGTRELRRLGRHDRR